MEDIKNLFTVGEEFEEFYGNGERIQGYNSDGSRYNVVSVVSRVSEKSCWMKDQVDKVESRRSWTTMKEYFENGLYKYRGE